MLHILVSAKLLEYSAVLCSISELLLILVAPSMGGELSAPGLLRGVRILAGWTDKRSIERFLKRISVSWFRLAVDLDGGAVLHNTPPILISRKGREAPPFDFFSYISLEQSLSLIGRSRR